MAERFKYDVWKNDKCLDGYPWVARVWDTERARDVHWSRHKFRRLAEFAIQRAKWKRAYPMAYRHVRALLMLVGTIGCGAAATWAILAVARATSPLVVGVVPFLVALYAFFYQND